MRREESRPKMRSLLLFVVLASLLEPWSGLSLEQEAKTEEHKREADAKNDATQSSVRHGSADVDTVRNNKTGRESENAKDDSYSGGHPLVSG
jgi:hypothetical protein